MGNYFKAPCSRQFSFSTPVLKAKDHRLLSIDIKTDAIIVNEAEAAKRPYSDRDDCETDVNKSEIANERDLMEE